MKKFLYSLKTDVIFSESVESHSFLLRPTPMNDCVQEAIRASLSCQPSTRLATVTDAMGNIVHSGFIGQKHKNFSFCSTGEVTIDLRQKRVSPAYGYFAVNTALTRPCGELLEFYEANKIQADTCETVKHWMGKLNKDFHYQKDVTNTKTTASEAWAKGQGVCQDFTQILLGLLRSDKIKCRYVAGLIPGEGATHAWVEFHDGDSWIGVDPTHNRFCDETYMKLSHGLDFSYCSIEKGIFLGNAIQTVISKCSLIEITND